MSPVSFSSWLFFTFLWTPQFCLIRMIVASHTWWCSPPRCWSHLLIHLSSFTQSNCRNCQETQESTVIASVSSWPHCTLSSWFIAHNISGHLILWELGCWSWNSHVEDLHSQSVTNIQVGQEFVSWSNVSWLRFDQHFGQMTNFLQCLTLTLTKIS